MTERVRITLGLVLESGEMHGLICLFIPSIIRNSKNGRRVPNCYNQSTLVDNFKEVALPNGQIFRGLEEVCDTKQCAVYRCQIVSRTTHIMALVDVPVPECPVQRTNPLLGCRDPLPGTYSKGWVRCRLPAVNRELEILRYCTGCPDSDNHAKMAKGRVMIKVRCKVAMHLLVSLFLVSWLRQPNLDTHVHLTRRPPLTSSQACMVTAG